MFDAILVMKRGTWQEIVSYIKKRDHAHIAENDEPTNKRFKWEKDDSDEEYVLMSTLTGTITHGSTDWLVDSGLCKHMMGYKESFINISENESPHKVKLGDDYQHPMKGIWVASYNLDSRKSLNMKDFLYVPWLEKNILSISTLDAKGMRISFVYG